MREGMEEVRRCLLTGVSYVIPFIASGGILLAFSVMFAPIGPNGPDFTGLPFLKLVNDVGGISFTLLGPVLAGYIAYARAGRPGLAPGMVGGAIANVVNAGFIGAIAAGLIAGYLVELIKKAALPRAVRPLMPILFIPITASLIMGIVMFKVLGVPIASLLAFLTEWLKSMGTGNAVVLSAILGAMIAFDMGGPVNKAAFFFGSAMIAQGDPAVMGPIAAAICVPPLGLGLATKIGRGLWSPQEREAGSAALAMGMIGITEGAIPFAAADPLRVIPTICFGAVVTSVLARLGGVADHAPHGGPIVLPVIDNKLMYVVAIVVGVVTTAILINMLKARAGQTEDQGVQSEGHP